LNGNADLRKEFTFFDFLFANLMNLLNIYPTCLTVKAKKQGFLKEDFKDFTKFLNLELVILFNFFDYMFNLNKGLSQ
jgi:hypothetical protein